MSTAAGGTWGFGLAGCGVIAETFASALAGLDGARVVAVHDVQVAKAEAFAAQTGAVHARSLDELVELEDVDVVCVCVPSGLHAEVGMAAVDAGKHLVVEKPIDVKLETARHLIDAAARAGVSLNVISQQRYNPGVLRAKALLDEGRLGEPLFIQARVPWYRAQAYYDSAPWRGTWALDGGGAFMNQGVHHADLLCWLFGAPEVIAAHCANLDHDIEVEDLALALLRFPNEAVGTLVASTVSFPGFPTVLSVNATGGSLELADGALVALELKGGELKGGEAGLDLGDAGGLGSPEGHRAQLADIVAALGEGRPAPVSGEDGYRALKMVLDVYRGAGWRD
jgi:UDP-N-acetyl-2-amino-2-deoxyglucuronate dehydrogenase